MSDILGFRGPAHNPDGCFTVAAHGHENAVAKGRTNLHGKAMMQLLRGWADYAKAHRGAYLSGIGEDGVLGDEWETIGKAILGLLNGETGGLDCGSIDQNVRELLKAEGFADE